MRTTPLSQEIKSSNKLENRLVAKFRLLVITIANGLYVGWKNTKAKAKWWLFLSIAVTITLKKGKADLYNIRYSPSSESIGTIFANAHIFSSNLVPTILQFPDFQFLGFLNRIARMPGNCNSNILRGVGCPMGKSGIDLQGALEEFPS